ncbi:UNKNOWN [Stylonychia lemnae]|uniref:Uncharacterized protein n=1 Tax=Stylonychia lemnae TaxID=5949 RepID=A0A077ZX08_STYLE|nr:UNKNOWN [Stylonychia lemnae]|eukprot:CDW74410.1 UNKNOWN [Stylonychia lemnae]
MSKVSSQVRKRTTAKQTKTSLEQISQLNQNAQLKYPMIHSNQTNFKLQQLSKYKILGHPFSTEPAYEIEKLKQGNEQAAYMDNLQKNQGIKRSTEFQTH